MRIQYQHLSEFDISTGVLWLEYGYPSSLLLTVTNVSRLSNPVAVYPRSLSPLLEFLCISLVNQSFCLFPMSHCEYRLQSSILQQRLEDQMPHGMPSDPVGLLPFPFQLTEITSAHSKTHASGTKSAIAVCMLNKSRESQRGILIICCQLLLNLCCAGQSYNDRCAALVVPCTCYRGPFLPHHME